MQGVERLIGSDTALSAQSVPHYVCAHPLTVRSNLDLSVLPKDTSTRGASDRTSDLLIGG